MYYRASGVLARLAKGPAGAVRGMSDAQVPAYRALKVSDAGEMTNASQPAFLSKITSDVSDVTGDDTEYSLAAAIWTEIYDQGGDFVNGTFTAPVTGKYMFILNLSLMGIAATMTRGQVSLIASNRTQGISFDPRAYQNTGLTGGTIVCPLIVDMDAADTFYTTVAVYNATKVVDIYAGQTFLSGCLLH
jgi:hypothetical protein